MITNTAILTVALVYIIKLSGHKQKPCCSSNIYNNINNNNNNHNICQPIPTTNNHLHPINKLCQRPTYLPTYLPTLPTTYLPTYLPTI